MKRIFGVFVTMLVLCAAACSKSETSLNEGDSIIKQSVYYVKYASDGLSGNGINAYNVSYTNEKGEEMSFYYMTSDSFDRVVGPVSAGFVANFRIWVANSNDTRTRAARIEVKKDDGPFAVKAEQTGVGPSGVSISYTL